MSEELNFSRAVEQLLELDEFFTGDFGVKGAELAPVVSREPVQDLPVTAPVSVNTQSFEAGGSAEVKEEFVTLDKNMSKQQAIDKLAEQIKACEKCSLSGVRLNPVPGEGSCDADVVFVGEAPGAEEDKTGKPFVGRAGKLLGDIIKAMGLTREQVYICNTLKCRPPENRDPSTDEKKACRHFLQNQLLIIEPKVIVALGSHAAKQLLDTDLAIGKLRGKFHEYKPTPDAEPIKLMPTYHPAYLLRNYNKNSRRKVWEDIQMVMTEVGLNPLK